MPNVSLPSWGILRNQLHPAKVLNSDFYLCPPSKSHVPNYLIDSKYFLIHKFQGIRHNKSNNKIVYGGHIFRYGRWFPRTRSFWDTQWYHVDSKVLSSCCCCFLSHTSFNGCGMGPLLVLVSHCFRENVVVRLCSFDNLLQKTNLRTYLTHIHTCVLLTLLNFLFCLTNFEKKYEFIRHGFSVVWFLVLILIHAILEQSTNNKMVSNYTNAKFIVISKPRT